MLREIGADDVPPSLLLNKIDRVGEADAPPCARSTPTRSSSRRSARGRGRAARDDHRVLRSAMVEEELVVPYAKQALLGEVYETARVLSEEYDDDRPDHEGARAARRHRAPAKNPRRFVS